MEAASCNVSNDSELLKEELAKLEAPYVRALPPRWRAGVLGTWASMVSTLAAFATMVVDEAPQFLLLFEDDAVVRPEFLRSLPQLLSGLPVLAQPWHAVRFATWGPLFEQDRVPVDGTSSPAFVARTRRNADGQLGYGGTHAVLTQRSSVHGLLEHVLCARGARDFDAVLRIPTSSPSSGRYALRTYAIPTSLVGVSLEFGSDVGGVPSVPFPLGVGRAGVGGQRTQQGNVSSTTSL
jgi:hypothetical protein